MISLFSGACADPEGDRWSGPPLKKHKTGFPRSGKSQGKTVFFQGQGKVRELFNWSGKFEIRQKSGKSQGNLKPKVEG